MDFGQSTRSRLTTPLSVPRVDTDAVAKMKSPHNIDWLSNLLLHPRRKAGNMLIMANYISDIWLIFSSRNFQNIRMDACQYFPFFPVALFPHLRIYGKKEVVILNYNKVHNLQATRSMSSWTRIAPEIISPRPNPGKIYALFA